MEASIREAVYSHIETFASIPVFYPNRAKTNKFKVQPPINYYKVSLLHVDELTTLLQIDILTELGMGDILPCKYIKEIRDNFKFGLELSFNNFTFVIMSALDISGDYVLNTRLVRSITIELRSKQKC
jgi:hypothetical protein